MPQCSIWYVLTCASLSPLIDHTMSTVSAPLPVPAMKRSLSGTQRLLRSVLQRFLENFLTSLKQTPFSPPRNSQQAMVFSKLRAAQQYFEPIAMAEDWLLSRGVKQRSWQAASFFQRLRSNSTSSFLELDTRTLEFLRQTASTTLSELLALRPSTPQNSGEYCSSSCLLFFTAPSSSLRFFFFLPSALSPLLLSSAFASELARDISLASSTYCSLRAGGADAALLLLTTRRTRTRRASVAATIQNIAFEQYNSLIHNRSDHSINTGALLLEQLINPPNHCRTATLNHCPESSNPASLHSSQVS